MQVQIQNENANAIVKGKCTPRMQGQMQNGDNAKAIVGANENVLKTNATARASENADVDAKLKRSRPVLHLHSVFGSRRRLFVIAHYPIM